MQHYIEKIFTAPVYDVATKTPLEAMPRLSDRLGHNILCNPFFPSSCAAPTPRCTA